MQITAPWHRRGVALLRIVVGIIFLWAGLDKLLGGPAGGWTAAGFLGHATGGSLGWPFVTGTPAAGTIYNPTHDLWVSLSTNSTALAVINPLVVYGEIGIGISLILGLLTRFGAIMGALMMALFFVSGWAFTNGIVEEHLTYMVVLLAIAGLGAGKYYGLDEWAARTEFGQQHDWIRKWILSGDPWEQAGTTA
jgi:thiosulfate dehydrogenase [quinone] large subunit